VWINFIVIGGSVVALAIVLVLVLLGLFALVSRNSMGGVEEPATAILELDADAVADKEVNVEAETSHCCCCCCAISEGDP
jgi:hypothetical protein